MSKSSREIDETIEEALQHLQANPTLKLSGVARVFEVPYQRLRHRFKGHHSRFENKPVNKRLSSGEEASLIQYLERLDRLGFPATREQLRGAANFILKQRAPDANSTEVREHWVSRFLQRHPEYKIRSLRAMEQSRKKAENHATISFWFDELLDCLSYYGIVSEDIWNMDETGFQIGIGRDEKVITQGDDNRVGSPQNRESCTVVESISAGGAVVAPFIILKGQRQMAKWYDDTIQLSPGAQIAVSSTGYTNDELSLAWLIHFNQQTKRKRVGRYQLLLLDGYGSHLTYEFIQYASENEMILFTFPPHTTHVLQPLDVVAFQPYKHYHSKAVSQAVRHGATDFNKLDFLGNLAEIRKQTFKTSTVHSAFAKTGIHPYEPEVVLSKLPCDQSGNHDSEPGPDESPTSPIRPQTPSPLPYDLTNSSTPHTVRRLQKHIQCLEGELANHDVPRTILNGVEKLGNAATTAKSSYMLACRDLGRTQLAERLREGRKRQPNRQIQRGGIVGHDGRRMKRQRDEQEERSDKSKKPRTEARGFEESDM